MSELGKLKPLLCWGFVCLLFFAGFTIMHENVHVAICNLYGGTAHVQYLPDTGAFAATTCKPSDTVSGLTKDNKDFLNGLNEVLGYNLLALFGVISLCGFVVIARGWGANKGEAPGQA